jgi:hypothetical protein
VLAWLAISNGLQGVTGFLMAHQLAHRRRTAGLPWLGVIALFCAITWHHGSPRQVAMAAVVVSACLFAVMIGRSISLLRGGGRRTQHDSEPRFDERTEIGQ